jgi:hypothetical protein
MYTYFLTSEISFTSCHLGAEQIIRPKVGRSLLPQFSSEPLLGVGAS